MVYKTVDLCAGIGGIRRGFEKTGFFKNVLSAEIDELACQTYEYNFHDDPRNDLTTNAFKEKLAATEYDVLLAGFPCQAFSKVGLQLGFRDKTKGTIFFDIAEMVQRTQPKVVFLENVENLIRHEKGMTFRIIINTLDKELGYKVIGVTPNLLGEPSYDPKSFVRNSKDFGMPQNRPRVYIIAFNRRYFGDHLNLLPETMPLCREGASLYNDVREVLETGDVDPKFFLSEGYLETLIKHKIRQNRRGYGFGMKVVNDPSIEHPIACTLLATGGSGRERNLVIDERNGSHYAGREIKGKFSPINKKNIRTMTPNEWGRLQGFVNYAFINSDGVDEFSFPEGISDVQKFKQFGNSVTIPVIETMAEFIYSCLQMMTSEFGTVEKRLYLLRGSDFLMCNKLLQLQGGTLRETTFLQWVDMYSYFGLDNKFHNKDLADYLGYTTARASQILDRLVSIGFAKKEARGAYQFSSSFIKEIIVSQKE